MSYEYRAVTDGTLSDPYRFVNKGERITSSKPINASWLVPADTPEPPPLPLMPNMKEITRKKNPLIQPIEDKQYDDQMAVIIRKEQTQEEARLDDDGAPAIPEIEPVKKKTGGKTGTGNKDVL